MTAARKPLAIACLTILGAVALARLAPVTAAEGGTQITDEARAQAKQLYSTRCTPCHGDTGKGDGIAAAALNPKPRDLTADEWQAAVKDDYIEKVVLKGGPAVDKSPLMPPNPDLEGKPEVIAALRELIRSFGKKAE